MKMRLLAVALISLLVINVQASSLREIIAQNPGTCAAAGYAVGAIGYQALRGCKIDPFVNYVEKEGSRNKDELGEFTLIGLQSMGMSMYAYKDSCTMSRMHQGLTGIFFGEIFDIARFDKVKAPMRALFMQHAHEDKDDTIGYTMTFDLNPILVGLATSAAFYGLAVLAAKK